MIQDVSSRTVREDIQDILAGVVPLHTDEDCDDAPPRRLTQADFDTAVAQVPAEHRSLFEEVWNECVDQNERDIEDWRNRTLQRLLNTQWLNQPILTMQEAAKLARITPGRLANIICDIKRETGRLPDFVVDGGGVLTQKIDRVSFVEWLRSRRPRFRSLNRAN